LSSGIWGALERGSESSVGKGLQILGSRITMSPSDPRETRAGRQCAVQGWSLGVRENVLCQIDNNIFKGGGQEKPEAGLDGFGGRVYEP